jgi:Glyoxalase/Bleomycin resistance protein/Dioxygenase superfamily
VQVTGQAGAVGAGALDTHPIEPTSRLYPGQQLRVAVRRSRRHGGTRCAYRLRRRSFVYCSASYSSFPVLVSIADRSEQASDGTCAVPAAHVPNQRFVDPGGFTVELACSKGLLPQVNNGVKFEKFLHTAWGVPDWDRTTAFYQHVLGCKASDWIGNRAGFFRSADRYHHSLVLMRSETTAFNHFCIQVESLDDVMRARNNAFTVGSRFAG